MSALLPGSGEPADDVTLLLVRTPGAPRASAATMIHPGPQHVAGGRRFVRDTLDAWDRADLAPTACLLVSELLANAMRHTREPIGLRLHHTEHEIIAEISDDHPQLPRRTLPTPADEDGRGLTLVDALADRWGSLPANGSKIVWFALATDSSAVREQYLNRLPAGGSLPRAAIVANAAESSGPGDCRPAMRWYTSSPGRNPAANRVLACPAPPVSPSWPRFRSSAGSAWRPPPRRP